MPDDREALAAWVADRDEHAFAALVSRHAGLVASTCRRLLGTSDAADDATQAVFILLAKHAARVDGAGRLGSWLHGAARRVCARHHRSSARRKRHEREASMRQMQDRRTDHGGDPLWDEARGRLDHALADLSAAQRDAVVGCYLEGRSQAEVAIDLGVSEGVVKQRLHYARGKLRAWFARRGIAIPASALVVGMASESALAAEPALIAACIQSVVNPASAPAASALAGKTSTAMLIHKSLIAAVLVLSLGGGGILTQRIVAEDKAPLHTVKTPAKAPRVVESDWSQWRGANRDGIVANSPRLLDAWPKDGPPLLWKSGPIPSGEGGWSSCVEADGKVFAYFTDRNPAKDEAKGPKGPKDKVAAEPAKAAGWADTVVCLNADTGKELWRRSLGVTPPEAITGGYNKDFGSSSTPAVANGKCYVTGLFGVYCLSVKDGSVVWQIKLAKSSAQSGSSPLLFNGVLYCCPECSPLSAYDAETGKLLWTQQPGAGSGESSPVAWVHDGKAYIILSGSGGWGTYCLDAATGRLMWKVPGGSWCTPTVVGDYLQVGASKMLVYKMSPDKADLVWEEKINQEELYVGTPLVYKDHIYVSGKRCLDLKTGAVLWTAPSTYCYCTPCIADGKVFGYLHDGDGNDWIGMFRATHEKYELIGKFRPKSDAKELKGYHILDLNFVTSPAIAHGKMYVRMIDCVYCYDLRAGSG